MTVISPIIKEIKFGPRIIVQAGDKDMSVHQAESIALNGEIRMEKPRSMKLRYSDGYEFPSNEGRKIDEGKSILEGYRLDNRGYLFVLPPDRDTIIPRDNYTIFITPSSEKNTLLREIAYGLEKIGVPQTNIPHIIPLLLEKITS
ncbi:MAG TPA: hypothetical protein VJK51_00780 [Candidatus Nanoarchaeia archaeon]|nr:hypothetical protein [Candidatus Nanoarchaeia archaeon]